MSPNIFSVRSINDPNVGAFAADHREKCIGPIFDRLDDLRSGPLPASTSKVCDSFVRIVSRLLVNAGDLYVWQFVPPIFYFGAQLDAQPKGDNNNTFVSKRELRPKHFHNSKYDPPRPRRLRMYQRRLRDPVLRSRTYSPTTGLTMESIEEAGARAGKHAAELYRFREWEGTCESERRALPDAVKAALLDAQKHHDSDSEDERAIAIYWASYTAAFEAGIVH
jgi:hypothetical protein